jgi:hypothetical protein
MQAQVSACVEAPAAARGGWSDWAAAGLSSLGLLGGSSNTAASSSNHVNSSSLEGATIGGRVSAARSSSSVSSPLTQDWHQHDLVQRPYWKQHEVAHQHHLQEQHHMQEAASAHSQHLPCATLQDKQLLPAAVGSFQHHKLMRADSLFGDRGNGKGPQHSTLDKQDSGMQWSPTWLLKSFMPFGTPTSPSALSAADSLASDQQQRSWGLLDACRVSCEQDAGCMRFERQFNWAANNDFGVVLIMRATVMRVLTVPAWKDTLKPWVGGTSRH